MAKFTANTYHPREKEFIPMDELIETTRFNELTTAIKVPLYQQHIDEDQRTYYDQSKWSSIICQGQEVNSVGPNYDLIQHQDAFVQVIDTLNKAGINMQGRVNDYGKVAWMDMVFENLKIQDPNGSDINLGYSVRSGYAYHGLNLLPYAVRGICSNGCIFNQTPKLQGLMDPINVSHVGDAARRLVIKMQGLLQDTIKVKGVFLEIFNRANGEFFRFSSEKELELTIASYGISEKQSREMLKRGTIDLDNCSRYELYNCLTEYATWAALSPGLYESVQTAGNKLLNESYEHTIGRIEQTAQVA